MLNSVILQVASKYLESDISDCLVHFLVLGTKASIWCGKHLKMTLMSTEESQEEEHENLFFQLFLDLLSFSGASFSALARYPVSIEKMRVGIVETFFDEELNMIKDLISEIKRIQSFVSEEVVVKVTQEVIDSVIRLCGTYVRGMNWESWEEKLERDKTDMDFDGANSMNHVINVTKCAVEKLCEMGIVAANNGGSLVPIINTSWKGVVTLLQLGDGVLATKVNVAALISNLISLVNESIRRAAEVWFSSLKESISVTEARKAFLPVKFYMVNAVKISSLYPYQAYLVRSEITNCILMMSTLKFSLSNENLLKNASDVFTELLEKTSLDLLITMLNPVQIKQELKVEILNNLFSGSCTNFAGGDPSKMHSMVDLFSTSGEAFPGERTFLIGRISLFLNFLRFSLDLDNDVKLGIAGKLGWFFDMLVKEEIYSSILLLQAPVLYGFGKTVEVVWQPMYSSVLNALQIFMLVVSSSPAWRELESFLLENLFHPHFLCWEIVMELWCFMVRHAESGMMSGIAGKLCSLMKLVASNESVLVADSALRKVARSISIILTFGAQSMVDQVYMAIVRDEGTQLSSVMRLALFMEGFPLNLLSDKMKRIVTQRIITDYCLYIENFDEKSVNSHDFGLFGAPVFALSSSLQSLQISTSDINVKTLKFIVSISQNYRVCEDKLMKDQYRKLLSETLRIISNMKHLYASLEMEKVIGEIENLFISGPAVFDTQLYECKPDLALFMAALAHMDIKETEESSKISALWDLYHMLLAERHWAFIHLALTAFGYFSARTNCNKLWRFVPNNAALSYDLASGNEANLELFMSEFKVFLEKETALLTIAASSDQFGLLVREGLKLRDMYRKISHVIVETAECDYMEIDDEKQAMESNSGKQSGRKRKFPDGIEKGMELLQSGMKVIVDSISQLQQNDQPSSCELPDNFLTTFSRLEAEISQLVGLAGSD
ncbi:uncharacterized protein LOC126790759 [Argentina anserina]|uniref:uncharacterized protein LOC126790759 n=1 Tax=Argentina anserina TaxID=57926 RepID=UPI00217635EA|nr:uncharacterized protein LOC126790759 [Potentilla anserina]